MSTSSRDTSVCRQVTANSVKRQQVSWIPGDRVQSRISVDRNEVQFREGAAPAEPSVSAVQGLRRSRVPRLTIIRDYTPAIGGELWVKAIDTGDIALLLLYSGTFAATAGRRFCDTILPRLCMLLKEINLLTDSVYWPQMRLGW